MFSNRNHLFLNDGWKVISVKCSDTGMIAINNWIQIQTQQHNLYGKTCSVKELVINYQWPITSLHLLNRQMKGPMLHVYAITILVSWYSQFHHFYQETMKLATLANILRNKLPEMKHKSSSTVQFLKPAPINMQVWYTVHKCQENLVLFLWYSKVYITTTCS